MNILWITNIPIGNLVEFKTKPMGGLWMDALLKQLKGRNNLNFTIVTTSNVNETSCTEIDGIKYYLLPGGFPVYYKRKAHLAYTDWEGVFSKENPDVIHIWGTEYSHSIYALEVANKKGIPSVVYIQGIMKAIANYANGYIPNYKSIRYITLRDIYRNQLLISQNKWFRKRAVAEEKLLKLSGSVVVENLWAEAFCKSINPALKIYKAPLNLNSVFYDVRWSPEKMKPHTILCNAAGFAYKGLHILLKAMLQIRMRFPDVKLYVPGGNMMVGRGFERQKHPGYNGYISDFITANRLQNNVVFTGYLTQKELAEKLSKANVFVLPSAIENHSSSLKEAMAVGVPCVASLVGGIPEYMQFGISGFTYRFEESECLAEYVCRLFDDIALCTQFSKNATKISRNISDEEISLEILNMYESMSGLKI